MPLKNCPDCGKNISTLAPTCPNCGRPMHERPEKVIYKLSKKLKELEQAAQEYENDRHYYNTNPQLVEQTWWKGFDNHVTKLRDEIEKLKKKILKIQRDRPDLQYMVND